MRASNSSRPLRATSSSLFVLIFLSIVLLAKPANTRSVARHQNVGVTDHEVVDEKLNLKSDGISDESSVSNENHFPKSEDISKVDNIEKDIAKDDKLFVASEIDAPIEEQETIGKLSVNSVFVSGKSVEGSVKKEQEEGIRRFDAVVVNEEVIEKKSGKEAKEGDENGEIGKTVVKGIIVRDAPIDSGIDEEPEPVSEIVELPGVKVYRKRSLTDLEVTSEFVDAVEGDPNAAEENIEIVDDNPEKVTDFTISRQVPILIPVGSSPAKLKRAEVISTVDSSVVKEKEKLTDLSIAEGSSIEIQAGKEERIPELTQANEKSVDRVSSSEKSVRNEEIGMVEPNKITIYEENVGEEDDKVEIGKEKVSSARKSLPISEENEEIVMVEPKKIIIHEIGVGEIVDKLEIGNEKVSSARKSSPISEANEKNEEIVMVEPKKIIIPEIGVGEIVDKMEIGNEKVSSARKSSPISEENEKNEEIVMVEPKKLIIHEIGIGEIVDKLEIGKEKVSSARKSLPIPEVIENNENNEERVLNIEENEKIGKEISKSEDNIEKSVNNEKISIPATSEDSYSSSLSNLIRTNESLENLKAQAISLQREIRDKNYLQNLRDKSIEILPGIPKFTEFQLLDALKIISSSKKSDEIPESSYLLKIDTTIFNSSQMQIFKCTESLLTREQRQTFAENMMECIRGLSILNCMRIFVWPIIADNIPESLTQNLPTLPIEINVSDWLPGNQQENPKSTRSRSTSSPHQHRLVTPEIVVSGILKDALNANPNKIIDDLPTFIDLQNETLSKWLTPGQLEILKIAEKFLPQSTRQEYSNRMFSCVRRFEYFSCVKYFAWPMVKQHYKTLPDFPDYQSWYPSVTLYPGYPILPYPNTDGIGELPEVIEADATGTRSPRPEAVIVKILENALRQVPLYPNYQIYQARQPASILTTVTADQMSIFYTAEQLIPLELRADFMSKTMKCIKDYDYLTCARYSTWPTVRQWFPSLPDFPDFSSFIPTFAVPELPDFSQYIPDFGSFIPNFPGFPGSSESQPQPEPQPIPEEPPQQANVTILSKDDNRVIGMSDNIENRIIKILSNIRWIPMVRNTQSIVSVTPQSLEVLKALSYDKLRILDLSKNAIPISVRGDLDSRFVGCLQGGIEFISCTRNVIWPTLQLYVKNMPIFPEENEKSVMEKMSQVDYKFSAMKPGVYQPIVNPSDNSQPISSDNGDNVAGRSPIGSEIVAEPEESVISVAQTQHETQNSQDSSINRETVASLRHGASAKSNDPSIPLISVTDTRFTPIFNDHPETVLLKILTTIQTSSKYTDGSYNLEKPGYLESLNDYLNTDQKNVIKISENLLPDDVKSNFIDRIKGCVPKSNFVVCSRDIIWPSLAQYYQRLPNFPNFYINDSIDKIDRHTLDTVKSVVPGSPTISVTDVNTRKHGDATLTITDTRFIPIFSQHPEAVILSILKNVEIASPNLLTQSEKTRDVTRSSDFMASFTDQQGNIVTIAENLLPETIRQVFTNRMTECVKENSFLACTRDIAWPTIAQFFPRLPNFPNIGTLTDFVIEKPEQPALLPPQLESTKPALAPDDSSLVVPTENLIPITPEDVESKVEATLKEISSPSKSVQTKFSFLNTKDPVVASFVTERQANVIRLSEDMLPNAVKPIFVGKMIDCARGNIFPNCLRNVGWPTLRQYVPNIPDFPEFGNYFPQFPQEIPQLPQFPDYQIPQIPEIPNFPGFQYPGGYGYVYRTTQDKIGRETSVVPAIQRQTQTRDGFLPGIQGLTPSVESASTIDPSTPGSSGLSSSMVPGFSSQQTDILSVVSPKERRKRRETIEDLSTNYQDISSDDFEPQLSPNVTEIEFLKILRNVTKNKKDYVKYSEGYFVEALNSTMKKSLTKEQLEILKIIEGINDQNGKGLMSQVFQCITGLSFIKCLGIFVWPVITQNLPSLLSLPTLSNLNPFGRSFEDNDSFEDIFGMTRKEFEKKLLERKENIEEILIDWYRELVEKKYENDYGFLRVEGYGDGDIGISFNGLKRKGRGAKIKDSKNMPSILTIISDIMEDMLDQRDFKSVKKEHGKRERSFKEENDYNGVYSDSERSSNDDKIIAMFIDKIKVNNSNENEGSNENHYLSVEDANGAFELLFGTRLSDRMIERLQELDKNKYRTLNDEKSSRKFHKMIYKNVEDSGVSLKEEKEREEMVENYEKDGIEKKRNIHSGLIVRLPKIDEEFLSRKVTNGLVDFGRKIKMEMSQVAPGLSFLMSFFVQMALAHARAAASVAGMLSNMALGSAVLSMIRQSFFGAMDHPKIKHVYDNGAMGPGTWPKHNYHG